TVASGRVNLNNTGNTISPGAGFTVESNATLGVSADGAASGLGGANVNLNGGTLEFMAASISTGNGLKESWFTFATNAEAANILIDPLTAANPSSLLNLTPVAVQALDVALNFDNGAALNNRSGGTVGTDLIGALWLGNLHIGAPGSGDPLEAGAVSFGTASDDGSALYIDANQDGVFDSPGEMVVNNKDTHGRIERFGNINLAEGVYGIGIGFFERTGGENMEAVYMQGMAAAYSEMSFINPSDPSQLNLFTFETVPSGALSNTVTLNADSTIRIGASVPAASLDSLVVNGNRVLEVDSVDTGQALAFTGAASLYGDITVRLQGNAKLTLPAISESVSSALSLEGDGTLALSANNDYTGLTTVQGGVLEVQANGALGEIGAGTLVNSNGVLVLNGPGNLNYAEQEALELNGHGNGSVPGALSHAPGNNDDYRGPITLGSDATIYNANNVLSLFGLVDNAGHELRLVSDASNIEIESAGGITGAGDVVADGVNGRIVVFNNTKNDFDGLLTVNNITWDARSNDALGSTNGTTIVNNGGRLEVRDGKTLADDITIFGTDNNAGAIRGVNNVNTLSGTITLGSDALIWINTGQVTLSGDLAGPFQATKQGNGTLVLDGDKTLDAVVPLAGTLQVNSVGGFGQTANLFVPQGATVAFEGDLNLDGTSALETFAVGGGRLTSISQTTTISIPLNLGLDAGAILGGAGDLVINANLGASGVVTSMPPFALNHYGFHTNDQNVLNLDAGAGIWNGGNPTAHPAYFGEALLTTGPANRGLDFNNDTDFINTGAVGQPDNYQNLWIGYVHCNQTGTWGFRNAGDDDRAGIWLDLNTNGVFESILPGLGSNRGEQLSWEDGGNKQVTLTNGVRYLVAFTHMEFSSGSRADFRFTTPSDPERVINPLGQAGRWSPVSGLVGLAENELAKEGSGTVYLNGDNGYGEGTTIRGGSLVPVNEDALGGAGADVSILAGSLSLGGDTTFNLGSVQINKLGGPGLDGAIHNLDGDNLLFVSNLTVGYSAVGTGPAGIGSADGRLTIELDLDATLPLGSYERNNETFTVRNLRVKTDRRHSRTESKQHEEFGHQSRGPLLPDSLLKMIPALARGSTCKELGS
ncbi:MAG: autotransporter-associated beta strand repeat-containing protein, partial [Verrucomicrobiota bacterium]